MSSKYYNALAPGYRLGANDRYEIEGVLGQDGLGITYRAKDTVFRQTRAVKEYLPGDFAVRAEESRVRPKSNEQEENFAWGMSRFLEEARTLAALDHPNIVGAIDFFEQNETAYIVMAYCAGDSLQQRLRDYRAPATEEELLALALPLLAGLAAVHAQEVLHLDIKPANIYIRHDNGFPVLLDFGAAKQMISQHSKSMGSVYTPGYAALELYYQTGKRGPGTDIYALAATLYQLIAGTAPDEAPGRLEEDNMKPAVEVGAGRFSQEFLEAVDAGLKVYGKDRPQSCQEWGELLRASPAYRDADEVELQRDQAASAPRRPARPYDDARRGVQPADRFAPAAAPRIGASLDDVSEERDPLPLPNEHFSPPESLPAMPSPSSPAPGQGLTGADLLDGSSVLGERRPVPPIPAEPLRNATAPVAEERFPVPERPKLEPRFSRPSAGQVLADEDAPVRSVRSSDRPMSAPAGRDRASQGGLKQAQAAGSGVVGAFATVVQKFGGFFRRRTAIQTDEKSPERTARGEFPPAIDEQPRDAVDCTVFAPRSVEPDSTVLFQVFVHTVEQAEAVSEEARAHDDDASRRGRTSLATELPRGSRLTFRLAIPGAAIDPHLQYLVWRGSAASVQFSVHILKTTPVGDLVGVLAVSQDEVPIGEVRFKLRVTNEQSLEGPRPIEGARRFQLAFPSFAEDDRTEVLRRVQMLSRAGIRCIPDPALPTVPDRGERQSLELIDRCDVFFLFWSAAAQRSKQIELEWTYCLDRKGLACMHPVAIEGPPVPDPPTPLSALNFQERTAALLPSGIITLVFTDIEGSSALWQKHGHAFQPVLEHHNRLVRRTAAAFRGFEVKTIGDAFFLSFVRASDAVGFSVAVQQTMRSCNWSAVLPSLERLKIRIGLHTGEAYALQHSDGLSDYSGPAVNLAARIGGVGEGGEVVVSSSTRQIAARELSSDFGFEDLGVRAMKGVGSEQLWRLTHADLA